MCYEGVVGQCLNHFVREATRPPCLNVLAAREAFA
jgi:hypothetical protein